MTREFDKFSQDYMRQFAASLNPDLPDPTGLRDTIKSKCYPQIFDALRLLPIAQQEKLVVQTLGPDGLNFPNGTSLAREIVRINNISWFSPKAEPDYLILQEKADLVQKRLGLQPAKIKIIKYPWETIDSRSRSTTIRTLDDLYDKLGIYNNGPDPEAKTAAGIVNDAILDTFWERVTSRDVYMSHYDAAEILGKNIYWTVASDKLAPRENPCTPLIDIYEQGGWPIGKTGKDFAIYWPEVRTK